MNAPLTAHPLPPYTPHAAVSARQGHHHLPQDHRRAACGSRPSWAARCWSSRARRCARSPRPRSPTSIICCAPRISPRSSRSSRTRRPPTTTSSSPSTSSRTPTSRPAACCRCARTPAPRSSWARRAGSSSPTATTRRALAEGARDAYLKSNLRYSQLAPLSMFEEKNTAINMPAQVEIYAEGEDALQVPVHRQGRRLGQQGVPVPGDAVDPDARPHGGVPEGEGADARHRGVPAVSSGDRDRRHLGRADDEDRQARLDQVSRQPADARAARTATPSAISRWSRRC